MTRTSGMLGQLNKCDAYLFACNLFPLVRARVPSCPLDPGIRGNKHTVCYRQVSRSWCCADKEASPVTGCDNTPWEHIGGSALDSTSRATAGWPHVAADWSDWSESNHLTQSAPRSRAVEAEWKDRVRLEGAPAGGASWRLLCASRVSSLLFPASRDSNKFLAFCCPPRLRQVAVERERSPE